MTAEGVRDWVVIGRIRGIFGVRGALRVESFTEEQDGILEFDRWWIGDKNAPDRVVECLSGRLHGPGVVVELDGVSDRDQAKLLIGSFVHVERDQFPEVSEEESYWHDLVDCQVVLADGTLFGSVQGLFETGANDVLVVKDAEGRERLIPYIEEVILDLDLETRIVTIQLMEGL